MSEIDTGETDIPATDARIHAAHAAYYEALAAFRAQEGYENMLHDLLRGPSRVGLDIVGQSPSVELGECDHLIDVLVYVCQGNQAHMHVARGVVRGMPKTIVERRAAEDLPAIVAAMHDPIEADELFMLASLMIELGLDRAVDRIRTWAREAGGEGMTQLAQELDCVENDETRWRLSRWERNNRKGFGKRV